MLDTGNSMLSLQEYATSQDHQDCQETSICAGQMDSPDEELSCRVGGV